MTDTRVDPKRIHKKRSRVWWNWKKLPSTGRKKKTFFVSGPVVSCCLTSLRRSLPTAVSELGNKLKQWITLQGK